MFYVKFKKYLLLSLIPAVFIIFFIYISYHSYISESGYAKKTKVFQTKVFQTKVLRLEKKTMHANWVSTQATI